MSDHFAVHNHNTFELILRKCHQHYADLQNASKHWFAINYRICVGLMKKLITTEICLSIAYHVFFSVLQWIITIVWILTKCYHQHNPAFQLNMLEKSVLRWIIVFVLMLRTTWKQQKCYNPLQNTDVWPLGNGLSHLCW